MKYLYLYLQISKCARKNEEDFAYASHVKAKTFCVFHHSPLY